MLKKFSFIAFAISLFSLSAIIFFSNPRTTGNAEVLGINDNQNTGYIPVTYRNIGIPEDMVVTVPNGDIWYADSQNARIVRVNSNGQIIRTVGRQGTDQGEFRGIPLSITVDNDGNLYVIDVNWDNAALDRIVKFDYNGGYLGEWGTFGNQDGQFNIPLVIHYDSTTSTLLVMDAGNSRIQRFAKDGTFVSKFQNPGTSPGQLVSPFGLTTAANGHIYLVDGGASPRVQEFDSQYNFIRTFTNENINAIKDIEVLSTGKVVVTSQNSNRVVIFNADGTTYSEIGGFEHPSFLAKDDHDNFYVSDYTLKSIQKYSSTGTLVTTFRYANSGLTNGLLTAPHDVAYDSAGNMYVLHFGGGLSIPRVEKYNNAGVWLETVIAPNVIPPASYRMKIHNDKIYVAGRFGAQVFNLDGTFVKNIGSYGPGDGQFSETRAIAWDSNENVYMTDIGCYYGCNYLNARVEKFDSNGNYVTQWAFAGTAMAITSDDRIYVANGMQNNISIFDVNGNQLSTLPIPDVAAMLFDSNGNLYVSGNNTIRIYQNDGTLISTYGSTGAGINQFTGAEGFDFNSVTGNITVADNQNHRVQLFGAGVRIENLTPSADVLKTTNLASLTQRFYDPAAPTNNNIDSSLVFGSYLVSDFQVSLTENRDWSQVDVMALPTESKALVYNLNPTHAPGVSATHSLYLVKKVGQVSVHVCPDATKITEVSMTCTNGYDIAEGANNLSTVTVSNVTYWKITGLTGTGAMSEVTTYLPTVTTDSPATNISSFTATVSGNVTSDGGRDITQRGVVFSSSQTTPTLSNASKVTVAGTTGVFDANITGLTANTEYHARAYATNGNGTSYGSTIQFTTTASTITPSVTPTVTPTGSVTPTVTPTTTVTLPPIGITTLIPVDPQTTTVCPTFTAFSVSSNLIQKGDVVTFNWATKEADTVKASISNNLLPLSGSMTLTPAETFTASFTADNGKCSAKKSATISVVETLPWVNAVAVGTGALVVEAIVATQAAAASSTFGNLWLAAVGMLDRKKKRSWGYIYNAITKKPVARAVVRLTEKDSGKVVDTVVSEINGAFNLSPKKGTFIISVTHPQYTFPSKIVTSDIDAGYTGIYHGEKVVVDSEDAAILLSIPLDPIETSEAQKQTAKLKSIFAIIGNGVSMLVMFGGFAYSLYATIVFPHITNYLILVGYIALISLKIALSMMAPKSQGSMVTEDGEIVEGVELGLYDTEFKNLLYRTFTTKEGTYSFAVLNKDYTLKVMDSRYALVDKGMIVDAIQLPKTKSQENTRLITEDLVVAKN